MFWINFRLIVVPFLSAIVLLALVSPPLAGCVLVIGSAIILYNLKGELSE